MDSEDMTDFEREWFRQAEDSICQEFARVIQKLNTNRRKTEDAAELSQRRLRKVGTRWKRNHSESIPTSITIRQQAVKSHRPRPPA